MAMVVAVKRPVYKGKRLDKGQPQVQIPSQVYFKPLFIKLFLEQIQISPKLRNCTKFVLMSEPAQKCGNF